MRETVLGPLQMTDSTFEQPLPEPWMARAGHRAPPPGAASPPPSRATAPRRKNATRGVR